ncbi:MAG: rRNA maturation RNase YbeY, partial [Methanomicrobia archaeon]|nr:rRNA maturation RNase YbeY [Methanomicrobia archaeon]
VDNDTIHQINRDYRHIDRPTDVISFAFNDEVEGEVHIQGAQTVLLGTILISVDKAKIQAEAYGHSLDRELKFLFIHGLLHLLGYDHQNSEEEKEMFQLQEDILGKRVK